MILRQFGLISTIAVFVLSALAMAQTEKVRPPNGPGNPLVTSLQFAHLFAKSESLRPDNDRRLKVVLITALQGESPGLSWDDVGGEFDKSVFRKTAGDDDRLTLEEMARAIQDKSGDRADLFPGVRRHADLLSTQFDLIEERHRLAGEKLVAWIVDNYRPGKPLDIVVICTGNSRRSVIGATLGNVASGYYGLPGVRFHSGGTAPTAVNPRTIATLRQIGVEVEGTGKEAPRGKAGDANPVYRVKWGKGLESMEFSKLYADARNPATGFAAVMVCHEADESCPKVRGAAARISVPYLDPKVFDGAAFEAEKYAERRDDIGRLMLNVLMQARRRLAEAGK